jgi:hypothetical protein
MTPLIKSKAEAFLKYLDANSYYAKDGCIYVLKGHDLLSYVGKYPAWAGVPIYRLLFEYEYGYLPTQSDKLVIMHTCENHRCCNIEHFKASSQSRNMAVPGAKKRKL